MPRFGPSERLVTIEDALELGLDRDREAHPDAIAMQAREPNVEGEGEVSQADLVRWALRMSPDRVLVGEIRGAEVIPMCNAMTQGNDGSMATLHASSSKGAFSRLATYAIQAPERLPLEATNLMVAGAVDFVVHLGVATHGQRTVTSVREVVDAEGPQISSNEIFRPGPDGRAVRGVPLRAETLDDLMDAGLDPVVLERDEGYWDDDRSGRTPRCRSRVRSGAASSVAGAHATPKLYPNDLPFSHASGVIDSRSEIAGSVGAIVLVGALTGWPVAALLAGVAAWTLPSVLGGSKDRARQVARTEAIAGWAEMLRDTLSAAAGLEQAIVATATVAPYPIRNRSHDTCRRIGARTTCSCASRLRRRSG